MPWCSPVCCGPFRGASEGAAAQDTPPGDPAAIPDPAAGGALPNPTTAVVTDWADLPDGREWGSTAGVDIDPIDGHIWAYDRCGAAGLTGGCDENPVDPVFKFHRETGEILASFGAGLFVLPHGIHVDADGNVWITDSMGNSAGTKGHQVIKFSPAGEVLLTLGRAGGAGQRAGSAERALRRDHGCERRHLRGGRTQRAERESAGGRPLVASSSFRPRASTSWNGGRSVTGPVSSAPPTGSPSIRGAACSWPTGATTASRSSTRTATTSTRTTSSAASAGSSSTPNDNLYAIDSESSPRSHAGWITGIRIGHASEDRVTAFIPPHAISDERPFGYAGEGVAVDGDGNVYAAEGPLSLRAAGGGLTKYVRSP